MPLQGVHPRRTGVPLPEAKPGPLSLLLEAGSNPAFPSFRASPLGSLATAGETPIYTLRRAELCLRDDEVFHLLLDVEVLLGLVTALPLKDPRRQRVLASLARAFDRLDLADVGATAATARRLLAPALALPAPRRTASSPSATHTSTRPGCGRCARRSASACARSLRPCG